MKWVQFLLALVLFLAPCHVAAWSGAAHQAIAEAAQGQLTPAAQTALARILQDTDTLSPGVLARGATWPDDLRARLRHHTIPDHWSSADVQEADQFNADHPSNPQWHFVDLPLGAGGYPATEPSRKCPLD